jgi:hypothetical protein
MRTFAAVREGHSSAVRLSAACDRSRANEARSVVSGLLQAPRRGGLAGPRVQLPGEHHARDGGGGKDASANTCGMGKSAIA